jgi:Core-2/I-Branching enzyme
MKSPQLAYIILCHKDPVQVIELIERLDGVAYFIHVDKRAKDNVFRPLKDFAVNASNVFLSPRSRCSWGGYGIVQATLDCIETAIKSGIEFDYMFLLSGQDYPIKTNAQIKQFISENMGGEFIETFSLRKQNRWTNQGGFFQAMNRVQYWTFHIRRRAVHLKIKRRFPLGWEPYGGSQWWCLSSDCIAYVSRFIKENPGFSRYFKNVNIPDETMFQTLISNSPFGARTADDVVYVDWENPNPGYPRILNESDFCRLKRSTKLFGRKFDFNLSRGLVSKIDGELLDRTCGEH